MRKQLFIALATAAVFASCTSHDVVNEVNGLTNGTSSQVPIEFNVQKQNITRAANLEKVKHYNFGVWAWKVGGKNSLADAEVMNNYLVGYGGTGAYDPAGATTYATQPGSTSDHTSPWFYEKLGTTEYTSPGSGYYQSNQNDYMSNNNNQYLRYWDLAYEKTNFYCYAPYVKNGSTDDLKVTFEKKSDNSVMTFGAKVIRDGYDEHLNSDYVNHSRTLGEFMYAGVQATNSNLSDVTVPFKHMGAQLFIRFYEDIPGYKVEIIDLNEDNGTATTNPKATGATISDDMKKGIQATPSICSTAPTYYTAEEAKTHNAGLNGALNSTTALTAAQAAAYNTAMSLSGDDAKVASATLTEDEAAAYNETLNGAITTSTIKTNGTYTAGTYYTTQGATVSFAESNAAATYTAKWDGATTKTNTTPLMFKVPTRGLSTDADAKANLEDYPSTSDSKWKVIQELTTSGTQKYSYSPTIYYPVAQPTDSKTGLTFHVSYRLIAEDNKEVITVHNATVHVPYSGKVETGTTDPNASGNPATALITVWQPNVKYTYTFKITKNSTGTTNPDTAIDPTDPTPSITKSLYPIVFDCATIDDYTTNFSEYTVSEGTNY